MDYLIILSVYRPIYELIRHSNAELSHLDALVIVVKNIIHAKRAATGDILKVYLSNHLNYSAVLCIQFR
jgi:hypothetical protein